MPGTLYILTGPSGVGKTTVAKELLSSRTNLEKVITCTTRPPREGEKDGVDYHFLTEAEFEGLISENKLFEWARVYATYYGSRKEDVQSLLDSGKDVLMVIDVQGAKSIEQSAPEAIILALIAESPETLLNRIERRDEGTTANLEERKAALEEEMAYCEGVKHKIVNKEGELEETLAEISRIMDESLPNEA